MKRIPIAAAIVVPALVVLVGCAGKSETVKTFEAINTEICACTDAECALKVHPKFLAAKADVDSNKMGLDWNSPEGKKETKAIEVVWKDYMACMNKVNPASEGTKKCQADEKAMGNSDACKACCEQNGRIFDYWNDPLAGAMLKALGGGSLKGCGCK